jgi:DnaK suppressor protein
VVRAGRTGGIKLRIVSPLRGDAQALAPRPRRAGAGKPLGKRDQKEFRRLLEEERDRLTEELEALEEHTPEVEHQAGVDLGGSYDEDFADVAGDTFEREKGFAIESSVQALLTQVEEALARLDEGTYGICENCGRAIHPARLKAIPYAKLCIDCKAREERANGLGR